MLLYFILSALFKLGGRKEDNPHFRQPWCSKPPEAFFSNYLKFFQCSKAHGNITQHVSTQHRFLQTRKMCLNTTSCQQIYSAVHLLPIQVTFDSKPTIRLLPHNTIPNHKLISVLTRKKEARFRYHFFDYYYLDEERKIVRNA